MKVEIEVGGKVEAESFPLDKQVHSPLGLTAFIEGLTQQGQCTAQHHTTMFLVALRPEERGEFLTGVQAFFRHQVNEQRQRLAGGKGHDPLNVTDLRCAEKRQVESAHDISRFLSRAFLVAALHY